MPLYEYECDACGQRFELIRKFSESELDACTLCGKGPVRRLMSSPAIQFKGTGWYITDYSSKGKAATDSSSAAKSDSKKSDSGSTETPAKTESSPKTEGGASATAKSSSEV
jgi:putative FmdB family regulatory protein